MVFYKTYETYNEPTKPWVVLKNICETLEVQYKSCETFLEFFETFESFARKLRNFLKCAEPKIVLLNNYKTILLPPNLKSFGKKMLNFWGFV